MCARARVGWNLNLTALPRRILQAALEVNPVLLADIIPRVPMKCRAVLQQARACRDFALSRIILYYALTPLSGGFNIKCVAHKGDTDSHKIIFATQRGTGKFNATCAYAHTELKWGRDPAGEGKRSGLEVY